MSINNLLLDTEHYEVKCHTVDCKDVVLEGLAPPIGYTPSVLDFYEELPIQSGTWSGPFDGPIAGAFQIARIGNLITMFVFSIGVNNTIIAGTAATFSVTIPARFLASAGGNEIRFAAPTVNNGFQTAWGSLIITDNGTLVMGGTPQNDLNVGPNQAGWAVGPTASGWRAFSVSWIRLD